MAPGVSKRLTFGVEGAGGLSHSSNSGELMTSARDNGSTSRGRVAVDILIIGFGYSVIPLLRELELRGQSYTIVSEGMSIWQHLAHKERLDFDLVSSFHGSVYSFDQVEADVTEDYYPTSREFYEYQEVLFSRYYQHVVEDTVTLVENHAAHSAVHTARGQCYEAGHVVFATGLSRPQNETIKNLDLREIHDQTIVFGSAGDTTNMMMARAVAQGNRVILVNNGFVALDKFMAFDMPGPKDSNWYLPIFGVRTGKRYPLDLAQAECHMMERYFRRTYKGFFSIAVGPPGPDSILGRLMPHVLHVKHPNTHRADAAREGKQAKAGIPNGLIVIKYWPIDTYETLFGDELEDEIRSGKILNDVAFFHEEGLVESWPKAHTTIDVENKTIAHGDRLVEYDLFVEGGAEVPRLPPIVSVADDGARHQYRYVYRENYLGVVPSTLNNVFFMGYTRPTSAGSANVTEMQGMMVHKLLSDPEFKEQMYETIDERIAEYNDYYYPKNGPHKKTDHVVFFGFYTHEVAKFLGIDRKLRSCLSWNPLKTWRNLQFELLQPNNALKFRIEGEYAVEGAGTLSRRIFEANDRWQIMLFVFLSCFWDQILGLMCIWMMFKQYAIDGLLPAGLGSMTTELVPHVGAWLVVCSGLTALFVRSYNILHVLTWSMAMPLLGPKVHLQPLAMIYIAYTGQWWLCLVLFAVMCLLSIAFRSFHLPPLSGRYIFSDTKYKHEYRPFWRRYLEVYRKVNGQFLQERAARVEGRSRVEASRRA